MFAFYIQFRHADPGQCQRFHAIAFCVHFLHIFMLHFLQGGGEGGIMLFAQ